MPKMQTSSARLRRSPVRVLLVLLCLTASAPLWAGKGNVTITNCGSETVWIGSYDWGDTVDSAAYESATFAVGDQHTLHCVKNLFTKDSPGCQIKVKDGTSGGIDLALWKVGNGSYTIASTAYEAQCESGAKVCLKQQADCSSDPTANMSNCAFSGDGGITTPCTPLSGPYKPRPPAEETASGSVGPGRVNRP